MTQYPHYRPDPWRQDEVDDYNSARSDDERRRILLYFGYDDAHKSEVWRLFPMQSHFHGKPVNIPDKDRRLYLLNIVALIVSIISGILSILAQFR